MLTSQNLPDALRRRQGAFFTPSLWAAEAHRYLDVHLGSTWREDCLVWDPAAGCGGLTVGYDFTELISTTLEAGDAEVLQAQDQGFSTQYDFLNDPGCSPRVAGNELPIEIDLALRHASSAGRRLVFLMNPPFATHSVAGANGGARPGTAKTSTKTRMAKRGMARPAGQLFLQFLYRCSEIVEEYGFRSSTVATFDKPGWLCSTYYAAFRDYWAGLYGGVSGFLFQASEFESVKSRWGVLFTLWEGGVKGLPAYQVKAREGDEIVTIGTKTLYNSGGREASKWVREPLRRAKGADAPQLSSGLRVKTGGRRSLMPGALYFFGNNANNLQDSGTLVYNVSSADTRNSGLPVLPPNWRRAVALYGARKLVRSTWVNDKDEYLAPPAEGLSDYELWVNDCHIYAILHKSNNCTSMRDVQYKGRMWQISNHFFWLTQLEALAAFKAVGAERLLRDALERPALDVFGDAVVSTPDPYMASQLPSLGLSPEALEPLRLLTDLWYASLNVREAYAEEHPELHLHAWDAGFYQLRRMWKETHPAELGVILGSLKLFEDHLRPGVYEHGFLLR